MYDRLLLAPALLAIAACAAAPTIADAPSARAIPADQQAFLDAGAIQCGFCMPGMIVSATELLANNPRPTREDIRVGLSGNLCRCSGYVKVVEAVELAARRLPAR